MWFKTLIKHFTLAIAFFLFIEIAYSQNTSLTLAPVLKPATFADSQLLAKNCLLRRQIISHKLSDGVLVMNSNEKTHDNFYYLTGWMSEPASAMIDFTKPGNFSLFIPTPNPYTIIWQGIKPGKSEAELLGAKAIQYYDFKKNVKELIKSGKKIYGLSNDNVLKETIKSITKNDSFKIAYTDSIVNEMRVIKNNQEIDHIRKAIKVTSNALLNAMKVTGPGTFEYEIAGLFSFEYTRNNCKEGFPSICGSGLNSTALHYEANNRLMQAGDVLLMDVGAKYLGYSADITRTIPVSGKFSKAQLDLYNIVLHAQLEGIKLMKPGNKFLDFHNKCSEIIVRGLYKLGLITDTTKTWQKDIFVLYVSGHYLGLNVHDVGRFQDSGYKDKRGRDLMPGMVITIEPGIYINPNMLEFIYEIHGSKVTREELDSYVEKVRPVFQKYANTGIRIEDDILITTEGNEVLSADVPKQPEDIERLMKKK